MPDPFGRVPYANHQQDFMYDRGTSATRVWTAATRPASSRSIETGSSMERASMHQLAACNPVKQCHVPQVHQKSRIGQALACTYTAPISNQFRAVTMYRFATNTLTISHIKATNFKHGRKSSHFRHRKSTENQESPEKPEQFTMENLCRNASQLAGSAR